LGADAGAVNSSLNPAHGLHQPLVIAAIDSTDPFVAHMLGDADSLRGFLASMNGSTHYLFTAYSSQDTIDALSSRLSSLLKKQPAAVQAQWVGRLHFTNGTVGAVNGTSSSVLGPDLTSALAQWQTPRNVIVPHAGNSFPRLDCKYASCPWPGQDDAFTLVAPPDKRGGGGYDPCHPGNMTTKNNYLLIRLSSAGAGAGCTPEEAAAAALKAGAAGVLVAAATAADLLHPINGASGYAAMIDTASGAKLVRAHLSCAAHGGGVDATVVVVLLTVAAVVLLSRASIKAHDPSSALSKGSLLDR
jgi:hypothetical protein